MKRAPIAVVVVSLFLAGCGKHYWNKPGASFADFSQDSRECAQENAIYTTGSKSYGIVREDLYRVGACPASGPATGMVSRHRGRRSRQARCATAPTARCATAPTAPGGCPEGTGPVAG